MLILGLDPGTSCGWALVRDGKRVASGVWDLRPRRHEGGGMRFLRVRRYLLELLGAHPVEAVAYEEVRRHLGVDAAHVYGGIVAALTMVCEERSLPYKGVSVGTIKKLATGKGNADKAAMVFAAVERWGSADVVIDDDNEADALWCAVALGVELGVPS